VPGKKLCPPLDLMTTALLMASINQRWSEWPELLSKMGNDFRTQYLPDAQTLALTNENLAAMEKSRQYSIKVQQPLYSSVDLIRFERPAKKILPAILGRVMKKDEAFLLF